MKNKQPAVALESARQADVDALPRLGLSPSLFEFNPDPHWSEVQVTVYTDAKAIVKDLVHTSMKYVNLVQYCRAKQCLGSELRAVLLAAGFAKSRVSEFLTLAAAPDEVFEPYAAGALAFKAALELARDSKGLDADGAASDAEDPASRSSGASDDGEPDGEPDEVRFKREATEKAHKLMDFCFVKGVVFPFVVMSEIGGRVVCLQISAAKASRKRSSSKSKQVESSAAVGA